MPLINDGSKDAILIENATIVWSQSLLSPEQSDEGATKWSVKVVIDPTSPDISILQQQEQLALQNSEFKGILPNGGRMALGQAAPTEFNGLFPGWGVVNAGTYQPPQIYDEQGNVVSNPMQLSPLVFTGQKVDLIVTLKAYNNKAKGIRAQLEGVRILASQNAQPIQIGAGSFNAAGVFGGGLQQGGFQQQQQAPQQQGGFQQQAPQQQGGFQQQAPQQQGGFQQQAPQQQGGFQQQAPQQQGGFQQQAPQQQGGFQQPQQATGFIPQQ